MQFRQWNVVMDRDSICLWCAYPDDLLAEDAAQECVALLSDDERQRLETLRFGRDRRAYLAAHALTRCAFSYYADSSPEAWRFRPNAYGKPAIDPDCGLRFNLSHCSGLVVCVVSFRIEVGIDAEPHERAEEIADLCGTVLSPLELAQFHLLSGTAKRDRALSLWTLKEAYSKARGMGLSLPLRTFSFLFDTDAIRLEADAPSDTDAAHWRFCLLDHAGHRIAIVVANTAEPRLRLCEVRPPLAKPAWLAAADVRWFPSAQESL